MKLNRYHRSFIGLMEQCNDGEWVKYEEAKEINKVLDEQLERHKAYNKNLFGLNKCNEGKIHLCNIKITQLGLIILTQLPMSLYCLYKILS